MALDMLDAEKGLGDPGDREYLKQCLETDTVIEYNCRAGTDGYIRIKGIMPTLFGGVCAILKEVAANERPEKRKGLLELVHKRVLEKLAEEGLL